MTPDISTHKSSWQDIKGALVKLAQILGVLILGPILLYWGLVCWAQWNDRWTVQKWRAGGQELTLTHKGQVYSLKCMELACRMGVGLLGRSIHPWMGPDDKGSTFVVNRVGDMLMLTEKPATPNGYLLAETYSITSIEEEK